jgi:aspartyl-tRNA(Asn)/glutamyl-tRNA(Gln) amidotransferase subunit A
LTFEVATLSSKLRAREISSVEATEAYLDWISERDGQLGSYITVTQERARADAARADREIGAGNWRGPFHGVPLGLKDNLYTQGVLTTGGSKVLADFRPDFDATAWAKLASQGAVLLGKLNLNEFAYGGLLKMCGNPYDPERLPGGSSAGPAAAVVAAMCAAAIGTDTSGSIRIPAAQCGCVGLKPTYGRVSRFGVIPLAYTMDHVGPMTRSVRDAALMINVIAGFDRNDSTSSRELVPDFTATLASGVRGIRVGIIRQLTDGLSEGISRAFAAALRLLASSGAYVVKFRYRLWSSEHLSIRRSRGSKRSTITSAGCASGAKTTARRFV